jgi:FkbM family methyltransferase
MALTETLQRLRFGLRRSPLKPILRALGVFALGKRIYEFQIRRKGIHALELLGTKVQMEARTSAEISRIDNVQHETRFLERMLAAIQPGDTLFDVGANIGVLSILLAAVKRADGITVHAFEPEERNVERLRKNISLNGLNSVHAHAFGLGAETGTVSFYVDGEAGTGTHSMLASAAGGRERIEIQIRRGDEFIAEHDAAPDVVKIDVEGAEMEVLRGMTQALAQRSVRDWFLEVHPDRLESSGSSVDEIFALFDDAGYSRVWESPRGTEFHCHFTRAE